MMSSNDNNTKYHKRRKLFSILSLIAFIIVSVLLTLLFTKILSPYLSSADDLRKFLDTFAWITMPAGCCRFYSGGNH